MGSIIELGSFHFDILVVLGSWIKIEGPFFISHDFVQNVRVSLENQLEQWLLSFFVSKS